MSKHSSFYLAGITLVALGLPALPGRSQASTAPQLEQPLWSCEIAKLRQEAAKLAAAAKHMREVEVPAQLARLSARRAELTAAVQAQTAELQERLAERVRTLAESAAERASVMGEGEGESGWLGVTIAEVAADKAKELKLPAARGVLLTEVEANSPAAKAGLKANDIVTEYNGQRVEGTMQFRRLVRETPAGRTAQLTLWREGRAQNVSVDLGSLRHQLESRVHVFGPRDFDFRIEMPDMDGSYFGLRAPMLGIAAEDLSGQLGHYFGAPDGEGVLVSDVKSGTPAEKAGLKAGDVITKVDGERVRTVRELREKLRERREKKNVGLEVVRKGAEMPVNVEIEQPKPPAERKRLLSRRVYL